MIDVDIEKRVQEGRRNKLKGLLFGLLNEREKNGEWEKFLDSIMIELYKVDENEKTINYYRLIEKMSKIKYLRFYYFRTLIFDCMNLIDRIG